MGGHKRFENFNLSFRSDQGRSTGRARCGGPVDAFQRGSVQLDLQSLCIFIDALSFAGAGDGKNILSLMQQPRQGDLRQIILSSSASSVLESLTRSAELTASPGTL
jgi:hypothetical protein